MRLIKCQKVDCRPHTTHTRTHRFVPQFPKLFTVFTAKLNSYLTLNLLFEIKAIEKFIFHQSLWPLNVDGGQTHKQYSNTQNLWKIS